MRHSPPSRAGPPSEVETMTDAQRVRLRSIALPTEHGGWGFTLEPILLGLLVAPTWAGFGLAVATAIGFNQQWYVEEERLIPSGGPDGEEGLGDGEPAAAAG